jgi:hypothetical protein
MTEQVLTTRALNRALLARQLLLERSTISIPEALDRLGGIQNQYAPNAYIRLWSCLERFARADLTRAYEAGSVVQGTLMRGTIHAVSGRDYHALVAGVRAARQAWASRIHGADAGDRERLVNRVRSALAGRSVTRAELLSLREGASDAAWQTVDTDAELVRVPPSGTWERRRADVYGLADDVIGRHEEVAEPDAMAHLVRRYLAGFGPATPRDIADFTGIPLSRLRRVLGAMTLVRHRDEAGAELVDVAGGPLPDPDTPAPVRFLPTWDATLLVHARRTQILPEEHRARVFNTKTPHSVNVFLVDGQVAGSWRNDEGDIRLEPFGWLPRAARRELVAERELLAVFLAP